MGRIRYIRAPQTTTTSRHRTITAVQLGRRDPLPGLDLIGIDWVYVGGESETGHRPMRPDWDRDVRDRCTAAGIPFLFKQWGGPTRNAGGRLLDERTWNQMPAGYRNPTTGAGRCCGSGGC